MTVKESLKQLEALGNEKMRAQNRKHGAGDNQFGVRLGDIRKLAAKIKTNHELAIALWETGNFDARLLAILLIEPKKLSRTEMDRMVRSATVAQVADWVNSYVVKNHPDKEALRQKWMAADDPWAARRLEPDLRANRQESGRSRPARASGTHRVRDGQRRAGSAMDDEFLSGRNRDPLPQVPETRHCHRRCPGTLS